MAVDEDGGKRHVWGPQSVGALVPQLTRPVFRRRAPASAQLLSDWDKIVGPQLAATTTPRRLSGSTLTLACSGPVALELQHMAASLMARINGHLGRVVVGQIRFVQDFAAPALPAPQTLAAAPAIDLPGVPEGPLHDALTRLGQSVHLARRR